MVIGAAACAGVESSQPTQRYVLGENASLCFTEAAKRASAILTADRIQEVTPLYAWLSSRSNFEARLRGASIELRPTVGLSRETVENLIECHRQGAAGSNDPFALPADRMNVRVDSSDGRFVIELSSDRMEDAREVLARSYALVGSPLTVPED
jgi:hypothetical protein